MILVCLVCWGCDDRPPADFPVDPLPQAPPAQRPTNPSTVQLTQRFCWLIALNPDKEEEFRQLHQKIPGPVKEAIRESGIRNYSVFVYSTPDQFQFYAIRYYEYVGDEHEGDMAALARDPDFKAWRNACEECEVTLLPLKSGKWWSPGKEVLHLD